MSTAIYFPHSSVSCNISRFLYIGVINIYKDSFCAAARKYVCFFVFHSTLSTKKGVIYRYPIISIRLNKKPLKNFINYHRNFILSIYNIYMVIILIMYVSHFNSMGNLTNKYVPKNIIENHMR